MTRDVTIIARDTKEMQRAAQTINKEGDKRDLEIN